MINSSLSQLVGVVFVLVSMMFSGINFFIFFVISGMFSSSFLFNYFYEGARPTLSELSEMIFPLPLMPNFSFIRWAQEGFYLTGTSFIHPQAEHAEHAEHAALESTTQTKLSFVQKYLSTPSCTMWRLA